MKKYEKIAEWIRNEIEAGALSLGDKLPPENELMTQFRVSRQTVRTALSLLRKEGIVEGRRGSGSYVTANVHRRTGKEIRSQDVIWIDSNEMADMEGESEKFLKRLEHCTACVCYNDEIACKLELILKKGGVQVPQDISIVGIDNSNLAELSQTPLTSLENPAEELGRAAAEKIAACVKHGVKMDTQEFDPRLVIRNSVRMKTGEERKEEHAGTIKERSL